MKKLAIVCMTLCFAFGTLHQAQAQSLDLGLKLGANFANLNDASGFKNKTGLQAGAFAAIGFDHWAIQPEVLYSQQGAKTDFGDFDLDYVSVPVMLKFYLIGNVLNVQAGPQFGFLTHQSLKDQIEAKDVDVSGTVGLGVDLPFGFRLDGRYNFGFSDALNNDKGKNGVFSLAVGYSFL